MWDGGINGRDMKALIFIVRNRKPMVDHAIAAEKITREILPFMYRDYLAKVEKHMWSRAVTANSRLVFAALRDGYTDEVAALTAAQFDVSNTTSEGTPSARRRW